MDGGDLESDWIWRVEMVVWREAIWEGSEERRVVWRDRVS